MIKTTLIALLLISATYCAIDKDTCAATDGVDGRCIACKLNTFKLTKSTATPPVYEVKDDCAVTTALGNKAHGTNCLLGWWKVDGETDMDITANTEMLPGAGTAVPVGADAFVTNGSCYYPKTATGTRIAKAAGGNYPADA